VATDHAPFNYVGQKDMGKESFADIPNGLPSVEDRVTLIYQRVRAGQLSPSRWVELIATNPAKMFGLYPRKGTIAPGFDADIVVFDPKRERVISSESHHMNVDYSAYEGMRVWGEPEVVMQRGSVLVRDGEWFGKEGQGRFVARSRFEAP
jgi:dihydropyrimidinase